MSRCADRGRARARRRRAHCCRAVGVTPVGLRGRRGAAARRACDRSRAIGCCRSTSRSRSASCSWTSPGSRPALRQRNGNELEIVVLLDRGDAAARERRRRLELRALLHAGHQPVPEARRPHPRDRGAYEYHVVPDRTRPMDFEVYEVHGGARASATGAGSEQEFLPFYAAYTGDHDDGHAAYFTVRREPRLLSAAQKRRGARSSYIGSEVFLSLVDAEAARRSAATCGSSRCGRCAPTATCRCRCRVGHGQDRLHPRRCRRRWSRIRVVGGPRRPYAPLADGAVAWQRDQPPVAQLPVAGRHRRRRQGAAALREMLELYAPAPTPARASRSTAIRRCGDPRSRGCRRRATPRSPGAGPSSPSAAASRSRSTWTSSPSRAAAPSCSAPCWSTSSRARVDQLVHRDRALRRSARRDHALGATVGRRDRRC